MNNEIIIIIIIIIIKIIIIVKLTKKHETREGFEPAIFRSRVLCSDH